MVEYEFNRLFVGPMKLQAAPYSSVYNDPDPVLMGKGTQQVKEILNALGLNIENESVIMSNDAGHLNRRSFLKGLATLGAVTTLPGGLLTSRCAQAQLLRHLQPENLGLQLRADVAETARRFDRRGRPGR